MGLNFNFVYLVYNHKGEIVEVYKRKDNAVEAIPEKKRIYPRQETANIWCYGKSHSWKIREIKVIDSNDLAVDRTKTAK